jgi:hypothetical protein
MRRATTVPPDARAALQAALQGKSDHAAALPDPLPLGRTLYIVDKSKTSSSERLAVLAGHDEAGYFLDYYRADSARETSWHGRLREDGSAEKLENIEGQLGRSWFPDPADTERDRQRIVAHNERVREILRKKGFL